MNNNNHHNHHHHRRPSVLRSHSSRANLRIESRNKKLTLRVNYDRKVVLSLENGWQI